ncbi:MAG: hypothetical protein NCW75_13880 [Phycisphaera sp.]|nr:MAG: hypothetical protein NCW75_13880 [Phycisphaera sp.]
MPGHKPVGPRVRPEGPLELALILEYDTQLEIRRPMRGIGLDRFAEQRLTPFEIRLGSIDQQDR